MENQISVHSCDPVTAPTPLDLAHRTSAIDSVKSTTWATPSSVFHGRAAIEFISPQVFGSVAEKVPDARLENRGIDFSKNRPKDLAG